jgi:hypothetical protein
MSNERIRELSKQAGQGDMFSVPPKFIDLFANLIIAECVAIAHTNAEVDETYDYACHTIAWKIQEHFGMK